MKLYVKDFIYIVREQLSILDFELKLIDKIDINNVSFYKSSFVDINKNIAKIYKNNKFYHSTTLPKNIENFIIYEDYIISFENNTIIITSLIGNKIVFNANIAKNNIKGIILKDYLLYIYTNKSIIILDILKKKIVYNVSLNVKLFDTDGENMVVFYDNIIYKIDKEKNISKHKIDINIDEIRVYNGIIFIKDNNNLYFLDEEIELISDNSYSFDIKDSILYSLEDKIKKYQLDALKSGKTIKFLTVDDSTTMRMIIKNAILNNFEDVEVFEAKHGKEALNMLEKHPDINVIFMDWNMPVMDGREAVIKIRENSKYDNIKIIMATTEGGKEKVREMISYGVKGYLVKPLKPASVVPVVEKMIELVKEERNV